MCLLILHKFSPPLFFQGCGLVKNLALMSHVTTDIDEEPVTMVAYNFGVEDIHLLSGHELADPNVYIVFVNGKFLCFYCMCILHITPESLFIILF